MRKLGVAVLVFGAFAALGCRGADGGGERTGPLASGQTGVTALAVNGAHVYWTMASGSLRRVPIDGGKVEELATDLHEPARLVVDDSDAFVASLDGEILRVPKTGGAAIRLADAQNDVVGIEVDEVFVYWATREGEVRRVPKNGGTSGLLATAPRGLTALAQQGPDIFWTSGVEDNVVLDSISANGKGPVTTVVEGLGTPQQLLVTPTMAYWTASQPDVVGDPGSGGVVLSRALLDGSNPESLSTTLNVAAMVGDDALVFVASGGAQQGGLELTSISPSGALVNFASGPVGTPSLTMDATNVYWTSSGDGNIFSLPKAETTSAVAPD